MLLQKMTNVTIFKSVSCRNGLQLENYLDQDFHQIHFVEQQTHHNESRIVPQLLYYQLRPKGKKQGESKEVVWERKNKKVGGEMMMK